MKSTSLLRIVLGALFALYLPAHADLESPRTVRDGTEKGLISVSLLDSDIRDALRMVALQGEVNIVMTSSVKGTITLDLKDVSLLESLDAIVAVGGFQYTIDNDIVTVSTLEELIEQDKLLRDLDGPTETLVPDVLLVKLRYVDAERVKPIVEKLLSETGTVSLLETSDHVTQSYRDAPNTKESGDTLKLGGDVAASTMGRPAKSHTLVVMDLPANLRRIERVVQDIDVMPASIVIETRFVEIGLDSEDRLGIDWNVVAGFNGSSAPNTFPFGESSLGEFNPNVEGGSNGIFPPAPDSVTFPGSDGLFTFGSLDFTSFSAVLEMIQENSNVQMVSNPRVVVNDRHTATILVGERYPILSANISEFGTVTEQLDRYEPVGVQLVVTPSILDDDEVELFVRPTSSSIGSNVEGTTGLTVARINSRQIDTAVTIKDGQTVVLGGLITTRDAEVKRSVPFLSSIPVLGGLFSYETKQVERVDLVIFLTVRIVREAGLTDAQRKLFEETSPGDVTEVARGGPYGELEYSWSLAQF